MKNIFSIRDDVTRRNMYIEDFVRRMTGEELNGKMMNEALDLIEKAIRIYEEKNAVPNN